MEKNIKKLKRALNAVCRDFDKILQAERKNYIVEHADTKIHFHPPADQEEYIDQKKKRRFIIRTLLKYAVKSHLLGRRNAWDTVLSFTRGANPDDYVGAPSEHQIPGGVEVPKEEQGPKALNMDSYHVKNDLGLLGENND